MTYAQDERLALCDLLDQVGSGAPTLCAGWTTTDLAAHLVLRERRPDAAIGILGGPLAAYTRRYQRRLAERTPFTRLVETIRNGPPRLPFAFLPGADQAMNFAEYLVHHEDVRRAREGWEPRDLSRDMTSAVWRSLSRARFVLRRVPVGIEFARDDEATTPPGTGAAGTRQRQLRITVRQRTPVVTVIGAPVELLMWTFGRDQAARVRLEGADADVAALRQAR